MIKPRSLTSLSMVLPCLNESMNLELVIKQAVAVGENYGTDYEVLVVDDGSQDNSAQIVKAWSEKNSKVRLVQHPRNIGAGAALKTGLKNATKDLTLITDADNQFQISDIDKLFSKIDSCDVVAGYRTHKYEGFLKRLVSSVETQLCRWFFGLKLRDVDCSFKLLRRKVLEGVQIDSDSRAMHAEVLIKLKQRGCRIEEIGVNHYRRQAGEAKTDSWDVLWQSLRELAQLVRRSRG